MLYCWSCGKATGYNGRPARSDECPHCRVDLRCCRGCRFYDASSSQECSETRAEVPSVKEGMNFCDYFVVTEKKPEAAPDRNIGGRQKTMSTYGRGSSDTRAAFDRLFQK